MATKLEFSVHEFMTIMGALDEAREGSAADDSVLTAWRDQYAHLDRRLEALGPMERADMLFDGKVTINAITEAQIAEVIGVIRRHIAFHEKLIAEEDWDADPEELEAWQNKLKELQAMFGISR